MIDDFKKEVEKKLDIDETIKENFTAGNYEMLKESTTLTALSSSTLISTADYSFNYYFIVTNKRIFIGNTNPYCKVISYNVYNLTDVTNITTDKVKHKRNSLMNLYYILGIVPTFCISFLILQLCITKSEIIDNYLLIGVISALIPSIIIYSCYRLISSISKPNLFANIKFKDNKELNILLKKKEYLDCLRTRK